MFSIISKRHAAMLLINPFNQNFIPDDAYGVGPVFGV